VARDGDYFGTTVNVAARILAVAGRDELMATAGVAQATEDAFAWEDAGARRVRGVAEPVGLCRLIGPAEARPIGQLA
jgi:adenylate cyclase